MFPTGALNTKDPQTQHQPRLPWVGVVVAVVEVTYATRVVSGRLDVSLFPCGALSFSSPLARQVFKMLQLEEPKSAGVPPATLMKSCWRRGLIEVTRNMACTSDRCTRGRQAWELHSHTPKQRHLLLGPARSKVSHPTLSIISFEMYKNV